MAAQQLTRQQHVLMVADDEIDGRHLALAAVERPQGVDPFQRRRQRGHRARRQGHADVAADGGRVPDLERGEEGAAALVDQERRRPVRAPGEGVEVGDGAGGGDAQPVVTDLQRRPAEGAQVEQTAQVRLRLREEPGPPRQPAIPFPPLEVAIDGGGVAHVFDRVQVHAGSPRGVVERPFHRRLQPDGGAQTRFPGSRRSPGHMRRGAVARHDLDPHPRSGSGHGRSRPANVKRNGNATPETGGTQERETDMGLDNARHRCSLSASFNLVSDSS